MRKSLLILLLFIGKTAFSQWTAVNTNLTSLSTTGMAKVGTTLYVSTLNSGVFVSTNNGDSWSGFSGNASLPSLEINRVESATGAALSIFTKNGFAFLENGQLTVYPNNGIPNRDVLDYAQYENPRRRLIGTNGGGIYYANNDTDWTAASGLPVGRARIVRKFLSQDSNFILALTDSGAYRSTNRGETWSDANSGLSGSALQIYGVGVGLPLALTGNGVYSVSLSNFNGWSAFLTSGDYRTGVFDFVQKIYLFGNGIGTSIILQTASSSSISLIGMTGGTIFGTALNDNFIFVASKTGGVFRASLSSLSTNDGASLKAKQFALAQNYPNPFNPSTVINYQLPTSSEVKLEVFDMLGRSVAVLVNERKSTGSYQATFNASNLSSGVYFYKLTAGNFAQTKRMLMLK